MLKTVFWLNFESIQGVVALFLLHSVYICHHYVQHVGKVTLCALFVNDVKQIRTVIKYVQNNDSLL